MKATYRVKGSRSDGAVGTLAIHVAADGVVARVDFEHAERVMACDPERFEIMGAVYEGRAYRAPHRLWSCFQEVEDRLSPSAHRGFIEDIKEALKTAAGKVTA